MKDIKTRYPLQNLLTVVSLLFTLAKVDLSRDDPNLWIYICLEKLRIFGKSFGAFITVGM